MMHFIYICPKKWSELLLSIHLLSYACPSLVLRVAAPGVFVSSLPAVWIVYLLDAHTSCALRVAPGAAVATQCTTCSWRPGRLR